MFTGCGSPVCFGKITQAGYNTSNDPPCYNSSDTDSELFGNSGSSRGKIHKVMELDTVEDSMTNAHVREVHAGNWTSVDVDTCPSP